MSCSQVYLVLRCMYHRELSAKRHMEYDLRQDPCVRVAVSISSPLSYITTTSSTTIRPPTSSLDVEVWILTRIIS